jgi:hypothetical protein
MRRSPVLKCPSLVAAGTLAIAALTVGCGKTGPDPAAHAAAEQELQALRQDNQELQRLRAENQELPRLRRDNEEIQRLREQTKDLESLRQENSNLRAELEAARQPKKR